ncbi:dephospho-CoA kinase [Methylogaea oryzae]|uniref:Dephospho-CoA kinase n=1 Tax=Methylogaea oryzae TaxID=1295382 RepID=A0A8D5AJ99_9GAMM|nr:dephospho-CoA kinase [Methylogaea oryzae]BBL72191.1 dephospho-CoA kinase [Methylogaea oryzae]
MLRIGLTGGIGSGKTTVGRLFAALGVPVLDADEIAHGLTAPGQPGHKAIAEHFGQTVLDPRGAIDRAKLRDLVFAQPPQRLRLEALLHPLVFASLQEATAELNTAYCILTIPLLFETDSRHFVDRVLVVDVPEVLQYQRVRARNGLDDGRIGQILAAQWTRQARLAAADDMIRNDGGLAELEKQVATLHRRYLSIAANQTDADAHD